MAITLFVQDIGLTDNTTITAGSLIDYYQADTAADSIILYQFTDLGDTGHFTFNGVVEAANTPVTVDAADLNNVQYVSGTMTGTDPILVNVYDPAAGGWQSGSELFVATNDKGVPIITGTPGNDVFNDNALIGEEDVGGGGHDTALIPLPATGDSSETSYIPAPERSENLVGFNTESPSAATPTYAFIDVESVQFSDGKQYFIENSDNANIARLYSAAFDRVPDAKGLFFWEDVYANNISASAKAAGYYVALAQTNDGSGATIADGFMQSSEFTNRYGTLTDVAFVNALYENVLGRGPDQAGLSFWTDQLSHGTTRATVLVGFAESPENVAKTAADWLIQL